MVLLDAAAYGHFGFAGYERDTTPVIDELAAQSLRFENAYSFAASTGHTVYAMLTSTYPFLGERQGLKGVVDSAFRVTETTELMPELLAARFPHRTGISSNSWFGAEFGFDRGFTHFYDTHDSAQVIDASRPQAERALDLFRRDLATWGDESAFAYVHFLEPHSPYTPPERFARKFDPVAIDSVDARSRPLMRYRTDPPDLRTREMIEALYDGNLAYVDSVVGELIEALKEAGEWEDTVFVLIADHGEAFWQHGIWGHGRHAYDEFLRIPFLLRIPGADLEGEEIGEIVSLLDLLPTYLDLWGLPTRPQLRGDSLLPLIAGRTEGFTDRPVFLRNTHMDVPRFAIREGRYKWIFHQREKRYELYDLVEDPLETVDLVEAGAVPPHALPLRDELVRWLTVGVERIEPVDDISPETRERLRSLGYF